MNIGPNGRVLVEKDAPACQGKSGRSCRPSCARRRGKMWEEGGRILGWKNARGAHVLAHSFLELFCSNFHSGYLHVHLHRADAFMNVLRTVWHIETLFSQRLSRFTKSQKGSDRSKTVGQLSRVLAWYRTPLMETGCTYLSKTRQSKTLARIWASLSGYSSRTACCSIDKPGRETAIFFSPWRKQIASSWQIFFVLSEAHFLNIFSLTQSAISFDLKRVVRTPGDI